MDAATKNLSIAGAVILFPTLIPHMPWRIGRMDPNLGPRFKESRWYSPFWATNPMKQGTSWFKLRGDVCRMVMSMTQPSPMNLLASVATTVTGVGGSVGGCFAWQACKDNAVARCQQYTYIGVVGILAIILVIVSLCCSIAVPMMMGGEEAARKKAKRKRKKPEDDEEEDPKQFTKQVAIVAFATSFAAVVLWLGVTNMGFKAIKSTGYYPWPAMWIGSYLALLASFLQGLAMYCSIKRAQPAVEEEHEYVDSAMDPQGMGPGGMPPMGAMPPPYGDPMMGGPDPMMGPMGGGPMGGPMGGQPPMDYPPPGGGFPPGQGGPAW